MKDGTRKTIAILLLLLTAGVLLFFSVRPVYLSAGPEAENLREAIRGQKRIVHAAGALRTQAGEEEIYTNSLDALQNMYDAGNRFF